MEYSDLVELIKTVSESNLHDFLYEDGATKVSMSAKLEDEKQIEESVDSEKVVRIEEKTKKKQEGKVITSPLVGTFYRAPSEESKPYVEVGDQVRKGQVIAVVEAMKLMNEIESEYDGVVEEIYGANNAMVEYGQPLFRIS